MYAEGVAEAVERTARSPRVLQPARRGRPDPPRPQGELEAVHGAARDGCCGFVALRVPPDAELACGDDAVSARNVAQLLDCASPSSATPLAQRFKGLRCVFLLRLQGALRLTSVRTRHAQRCGAVSNARRARRRCAGGRMRC
jgi:hypothetical protein